MKKIVKWFSEMFADPEFTDLNMAAIGEALNDLSVRTIWLNSCLTEIKRIHMEVDSRLLSGNPQSITDLCARRKAFRDMLESILSARRQVMNVQERPNPKSPILVDLDRVTA